MSLRKITFENQQVSCQEDETVLEALLRENIDIPHSCRQGVCQSCMVRSLQGTPPVEAQTGLKDVLKHQNYFLACMCHPQEDMTISVGDTTDFYSAATVIDKQFLNAETVLLSLETRQPLDYYAGQFVNLRRADGLVRSYSIANNRIFGKQLTFHIRKLTGGRFSAWVHHELNIGDTIDVSASQGLCYYLPNNLEQNLLLIGTGSGLAPLAGIISEALHHGHSGAIHLYHGSREIEGLYWIEEMQRLSSLYPQFHYTPCVSGGEAPENFAKGRANEVAIATLPSLKGWRVYLCGHPDMVHQSKRQAFLKGAAFQDIYADAFHVTPVTAE